MDAARLPKGESPRVADGMRHLLGESKSISFLRHSIGVRGDATRGILGSSERSRSLVSRAWDPLPFVLVADSRGAEMERHFRAHCPRRHLKGPPCRLSARARDPRDQIGAVLQPRRRSPLPRGFVDNPADPQRLSQRLQARDTLTARNDRDVT